MLASMMLPLAAMHSYHLGGGGGGGGGGGSSKIDSISIWYDICRQCHVLTYVIVIIQIAYTHKTNKTKKNSEFNVSVHWYASNEH